MLSLREWWRYLLCGCFAIYPWRMILIIRRKSIANLSCWVFEDAFIYEFVGFLIWLPLPQASHQIEEKEYSQVIHVRYITVSSSDFVSRQWFKVKWLFLKYFNEKSFIFLYFWLILLNNILTSPHYAQWLLCNSKILNRKTTTKWPLNNFDFTRKL